MVLREPADLDIGESGGFRKLEIKNRQLAHVIVRCHLSQQIGRGKGKSEGALQLALKRDSLEVGVHPGATNHVLDRRHVGFGVPLLAQKLAGEDGTSADVNRGVFRAGALGVFFPFQITGVVKQHGQQRQLEHLRGCLRRRLGRLTPPQQACQAERALQRVLEIVVARVDRLVIGKPA